MTTLASALRRRPVLVVFLAVVLYSTGPVLAQASDLAGPVFAAWRLWFGVGVFVLLALFRRLGGTRALGAPLLRWSLIGGVAYAGHQLLFFSAVKATSVADVTLMNTLAPILVGIAAIPLFGERPGWSFRLWSLVSICGAAIIAVAGSYAPQAEPLGMAMAAGNVVFYTAFFLLSIMARRDGVDSIYFLLGTLFVAAVLVTAYTLLTHPDAPAPSTRDLQLLLAVAVLPGAIGHFAYTWPLPYVRANVPPLVRLAKPVFASFLAWLFLGETLGSAHLVGGVLALGGVAGALLSPSGRSFARAVPADPEALVDAPARESERTGSAAAREPGSRTP